MWMQEGLQEKSASVLRPHFSAQLCATATAGSVHDSLQEVDFSVHYMLFKG